MGDLMSFSANEADFGPPANQVQREDRTLNIKTAFWNC
jgi:hypothetical protein